jgi:ParB family chromosome partitioning protein
MNLDLTGLADVGQPAAGEPLMVALDAIACDSDQPRQHFDEEALQELADSIRAIGVVQPVSVRPDPALPGRYIINYGERRYRAALIAGLHSIPAFVHKAPDTYMQVAENLHRADLSPMEMALFIRKRMEAGDSRTEIAAGLGYKKSYVTEHLALLESPACVEKAYASGVSSARTLYDLRRVHDEFPRQVDAWIASGAEVTRESVAALAERVRHDEQRADVLPDVQSDAGSPLADQLCIGTVPLPSAAANDKAEKVRHDEQLNAQPSIVQKPDKSSVAFEHAKALTVPAVDIALQQHDHVPADDVLPADRPRVHLSILVEHDGRSATVQADSIVCIRYEDGGMAEVRLGDTVFVAAVGV